MDKKTIIDQIKTLRKQKGVSQKELAQKLGVGSSYISNIETGATNVSIEQLQKVLEVLGADITDFIDNSQKKKDLLEWISKIEEGLENVKKIVKGL